MVQKGVAKNGSDEGGSSSGDLNWSDLKYFLAVVEHKTSHDAAKTLGIHPSTVTRRIDNLESRLKEPVFYRTPYGMKLTEFGKAILEDALQAQGALAAIERKARSAATEVQGRVRLAVTEGVGGMWLMPHLIGFQRSFPDVILETQCAMTLADILRLNAEISVQLTTTDKPDLIQSRIGRLHLSLFASRDYLETYGVPESMSDLKTHKLITQFADQVEEQKFLEFVDAPDPRGVVAFRTNSSIGAYALIDRGAGIGVLPTYIMAMGAGVVPLDLGGRYHVDVYLVYHPDVKRTRSHELVIEEIRRCFDARRFPWFGDDYMAPGDIAALPRDEWAHVMPSSVAV